jgi:uncharacterized protein (TIGR03435 family)
MLRRLAFAALVISVSAIIANAQAVPALPKAYDVTTIKPHDPADGGMMWRYREASFEATNMSLQNLISSAYNVKSWLIFGLPSWTESARYDIQAKISDADPAVINHLTPEQRRNFLGELLIGLLKDRFSLQAHMETKEQPVFELSTLPEGPRFQPTPPPAPSVDGGTQPKQQGSYSYGNGKLNGTYMDIPTLAETLSYQVERTIINKSGLTGRYNINLRWTPADQQGKQLDNGTGDTPPDIFTALREQLGLKLTAAKAPVPTVVVDKITQPEAN